MPVIRGRKIGSAGYQAVRSGGSPSPKSVVSQYYKEHPEEYEKYVARTGSDVYNLQTPKPSQPAPVVSQPVREERQGEVVIRQQRGGKVYTTYAPKGFSGSAVTDIRTTSKTAVYSGSKSPLSQQIFQVQRTKDVVGTKKSPSDYGIRSGMRAGEILPALKAMPEGTTREELVRAVVATQSDAKTRKQISLATGVSIGLQPTSYEQYKIERGGDSGYSQFRARRRLPKDVYKIEMVGGRPKTDIATRVGMSAGETLGLIKGTSGDLTREDIVRGVAKTQESSMVKRQISLATGVGVGLQPTSYEQYKIERGDALFAQRRARGRLVKGTSEVKTLKIPISKEYGYGPLGLLPPAGKTSKELELRPTSYKISDKFKVQIGGSMPEGKRINIGMNSLSLLAKAKPYTDKAIYAAYKSGRSRVETYEQFPMFRKGITNPNFLKIGGVYVGPSAAYDFVVPKNTIELGMDLAAYAVSPYIAKGVKVGAKYVGRKIGKGAIYVGKGIDKAFGKLDDLGKASSKGRFTLGKVGTLRGGKGRLTKGAIRAKNLGTIKMQKRGTTKLLKEKVISTKGDVEEQKILRQYYKQRLPKDVGYAKLDMPTDARLKKIPYKVTKAGEVKYYKVYPEKLRLKGKSKTIYYTVDSLITPERRLTIKNSPVKISRGLNPPLGKGKITVTIPQKPTKLTIPASTTPVKVTSSQPPYTFRMKGERIMTPQGIDLRIGYPQRSIVKNPALTKLVIGKKSTLKLLKRSGIITNKMYKESVRNLATGKSTTITILEGPQRSMPTKGGWRSQRIYDDLMRKIDRNIGKLNTKRYALEVIRMKKKAGLVNTKLKIKKFGRYRRSTYMPSEKARKVRESPYSAMLIDIKTGKKYYPQDFRLPAEQAGESGFSKPLAGFNRKKLSGFSERLDKMKFGGGLERLKDLTGRKSKLKTYEILDDEYFRGNLLGNNFIPSRQIGTRPRISMLPAYSVNMKVNQIGGLAVRKQLPYDLGRLGMYNSLLLGLGMASKERLSFAFNLALGLSAKNILRVGQAQAQAQKQDLYLGGEEISISRQAFKVLSKLALYQGQSLYAETTTPIGGGGHGKGKRGTGEYRQFYEPVKIKAPRIKPPRILLPKLPKQERGRLPFWGKKKKEDKRKGSLMRFGKNLRIYKVRDFI